MQVRAETACLRGRVRFPPASANLWEAADVVGEAAVDVLARRAVLLLMSLLRLCLVVVAAAVIVGWLVGR